VTFSHKAALENMIQRQLRSRGINNPAVLDAMSKVPRHEFVPEAGIEEAYGDHALPTLAGQTISQPYMVARMTELLDVKPGMNVLEIGTGSGYQAAILAAMDAQVTSVERYESLASQARSRLAQLLPDAQIKIILGDGTAGYADNAPYDRILVTAAAPRLPEAYREQLKNPGIVVIPIGDRIQQTLTVFYRHGEDWQRTHDVPCRFVLLIGRDAWP